MRPTTRVTYLFDPLCGWCYGASPALEKLVAEPGFAVDLAPTGFFAGEGARPMDARFAAFVWTNDERIARLTGQPFSEEYRRTVLGDHRRLLDSAPATLALTAVRLTRPEQEFAALRTIQYTRYVVGLDITDMSVLADVLRGLGFDDVAARFSAPDPALLAAYHQRLDGARADMRRFGLEGVPALIVGDGEARRAVRSSALFGSLDILLSGLRAA